MNTTVVVIILVALLVSLLVIFAVLMWYINNKEERQIKNIPHYRHDVIVSGGVDIVTGQMTHNDHLYFNGMKETQNETICIGMSGAMSRQHNSGHSIRLTDQAAGNTYTASFSNEVIIGRNPKQNTGAVIVLKDSSVSGVHCRVYHSAGSFYIQDLGSSNHTYLNGNMVTTALPVNNGDTVRIGACKYKVSLQ